MKFVRQLAAYDFRVVNSSDAIIVKTNGLPDVQVPPQVWLSWTIAQQIAVGLFQVEPFVVPPGKEAYGEPIYTRVRDFVTETYEVRTVATLVQPPARVAAVYNIPIVDGDVGVTGGLFNIAAAVYADVGSYMLFFSLPQPDLNYFVVSSGLGQVTEKTTDYFVIEMKSVDGEATAFDPIDFSVQVFRLPT